MSQAQLTHEGSLLGGVKAPIPKIIPRLEVEKRLMKVRVVFADSPGAVPKFSPTKRAFETVAISGALNSRAFIASFGSSKRARVIIWAKW